MLEHVVEGQVLDLVVGGVNVVVRVLKGRLDHESRGIACLGGRGVVGAGITAFSFNIGNVTILYAS